MDAFRRPSKMKVAGLLLVLTLLIVVRPSPAPADGATVLARVEVSGMVSDLGLPVYAHLQGADGVDYALVITARDELELSGAVFRVLDRIDPQASGRDYLIALERKAGARARAAQAAVVLHDDGRQIVVWASPAEAETLVGLGYEIAWLPEEPLVLEAPRRMFFEVAPEYDPLVAEQLAKVSMDEVKTLTGNLSGENTVVIGGKEYKIESRNTNTTTWQALSTQYVYEFLQAQGLEVSYHTWQSPKRNVIAEKPGTTHAEEIVLVTAHLDCMPSSGRAPGADDNASGSVGVMLAAKIMKDYSFGRTIRFVLFTGEEQGLLGSYQYAKKVADAGENIVAVLNMDMIGWDDVGGPVLRLHTRTTSNPGHAGDKAIASLFIEVVNLYGMGAELTPLIDADGISASDHASFWGRGFSGILAIEDDENDFNDYYHTANDKLDKLNLPYFTHFVKAALGTAAHLAAAAGGGDLIEIVSVSTGKPYALTEAKSGTQAYIDRTYTVNGISAGLSGGVLVQTANDDKAVSAAAHLKLKALKDAVLYVAYDKRASKLPTWLAGWSATAESLSTTDKDASPLKVYKKTLTAGSELTLGGNLNGGDTGARSNYLVVAKPYAASVVEIESVSTGKPYATTEAKTGVRAYIDRDYTVNGISTGLSGGVLVQTANDDKKVNAANHLVLKVNQAATVYVAYDKRASKLPTWLGNGWVSTGESLSTTDTAAAPLKVYKKTVAAGAKLTLGGNLQGGDTGARSHYLVVVKP